MEPPAEELCPDSAELDTESLQAWIRTWGVAGVEKLSRPELLSICATVIRAHRSGTELGGRRSGDLLRACEQTRPEYDIEIPEHIVDAITEVQHVVCDAIRRFVLPQSRVFMADMLRRGVGNVAIFLDSPGDGIIQVAFTAGKLNGSISRPEELFVGNAAIPWAYFSGFAINAGFRVDLPPFAPRAIWASEQDEEAYWEAIEERLIGRFPPPAFLAQAGGYMLWEYDPVYKARILVTRLPGSRRWGGWRFRP